MQEGFKHKNPQVKAESLRFLIRCLRTTPSPPNKAETQIVGEAAIKLLGDTAEPVRAAAQEALGTLMKIVGERAMIQFLDPVDDIRKAKIREFFEKAEVKAKQRTAPPPKANGPGAKRPGAANGPKAGGGVAKVAGGASGIARTNSLKRPGSTASSVDREPDSPKKSTIVRPGMRPPTTTSSSASSSAGSAPPSRLGPRQSVVPSARAGSPVQPPAPKKAPSDDPPKLSRGLMGRVLPPSVSELIR
jgi:protein STU2